MKTNKILAAVVALTTVASSMASMATMSADAAKIPGIDSEFEYGLTATAVSDSQIKVTFYTVNNPGITVFSFAFLYDSDRYSSVKTKLVTDDEYEGYMTRTGANNAEEGIFVFAASLDGDCMDTETTDYCCDFEFSLYLEAKDGDVTDEDVSAFSCAILSYNSIIEDINYDYLKTGTATDAPRETLTITPAQSFIYKYMLGDADGSESLTISDATAIQNLATCAVATNVTPSINILNDKISNNAVDTTASGTEIAWGSRFGTFMRNVDNVSFPCVEAADINKDNRVTKDDVQLVLDKYAEINSNVSTEDILEIVDKTIYCNF